MMYIAIGPYCWGKATTIGAAIRGMKRACPTFVKKETLPYNVLEVDNDAWVDDHGNVCSDAGKPKKIRAVTYVGTQRVVKEKFDELPKV